MPPRKAHTKSRNGCDQCKKRRVKCSEQGPPCSNCMARELDCTYLRIPRPRGLVDARSESPTRLQSPNVGLEPTDRSLTAAGTTSLFQSFRIRELELMHKFSTETYLSLCNDPSDYHDWQFVIPRKALDHDFLLSGILAVASLHTATTIEPTAASTYIDIALEYHNKTFAPFRQALDNLTPQNCEAAFAHSIITIVIGISLPQLTAEKDESSTMTENIMVVFELLQGVKRILTISKPWLQTRLFTPARQRPKASISKLDSETEDALDQLIKLNDETMANVNSEQHYINKDAICLLRRCYLRYANSGEAASVLTWISAVSRDFIYGLRRRRPFPLLILMHWGVLLRELDGKMWWAKGSGKALVAELLAALPPGIFERETVRLWPKEKLGL